MNPKLHFFKDSNIPAFILSVFFVVYGFINISNKLWIQIIMGFLGVYVEYEAYKIWGLSFAHKKAGLRYEWMRGIYIAYIVIFALPSAIGFFAVEIVAQDNTAQVIQDNREINRARIKQLPKLIADARSDMNYEREHGGTYDKYKAAKKEYDDLSAEYERLTNPNHKTQTTIVKLPKPNMFDAVSKVFWGFPKYTLILIMCTAALAMVYIGMMLQPPVITICEVETKPNTVKNEPITPPTEPITNEQNVIKNELPKPSEVITNQEVSNSLDIRKQKLIRLAECLYTDNPNRLNGLSVAYNKLKDDPGISYRECARLIEKLNEIGAINTTPGNSRANWPLDKTIEYIKTM